MGLVAGQGRGRRPGLAAEGSRGGRVRALSEIRAWLDNPEPAPRVLIVTGSPGVGKSEVLGRIVTTADQAIRAALPDDDDGVKATPGSVACAVHAKAKTALDVATEIARAAAARLHAQPADLAPAIRDALQGRAGTRFNVIIDALDETVSPDQARAVITKIALPLTETCADVGARVVIGTRRRDDDGSLLEPFGRTARLIDLDEAEYFDVADLSAYALACLRLTGAERPGNPYHDDSAANALAGRIAELSDRNFLLAGIIARDHGLHDDQPLDPRGLTFDPSIETALIDYLARVGRVGGLPADQALTALAFAEAPGLPASLWQTYPGVV